MAPKMRLLAEWLGLTVVFATWVLGPLWMSSGPQPMGQRPDEWTRLAAPFVKDPQAWRYVWSSEEILRQALWTWVALGIGLGAGSLGILAFLITTKEEPHDDRPHLVPAGRRQS